MLKLLGITMRPSSDMDTKSTIQNNDMDHDFSEQHRSVFAIAEGERNEMLPPLPRPKLYEMAQNRCVRRRAC